jgi:hypothetical protein
MRKFRSPSSFSRVEPATDSKAAPDAGELEILFYFFFYFSSQCDGDYLKMFDNETGDGHPGDVDALSSASARARKLRKFKNKKINKIK